MILYLMRHGIAYDQSAWHGAEFDRPLTAEGFERTRKVLETLHRKDAVKVDEIWSSPLARAYQTAEIAAVVLGAPLIKVGQLQCGADLKTMREYVEQAKLPKRLMWVGHEPDCGQFVADLTGKPDQDIAFKRAGIACLDGKLARGEMKLVWYKSPKDVLGD